MSYQEAKDRNPMPDKTLSEENQALSAENSALKDEIQNLRARLEEAEELKRAISEGDLDALVIPGSVGELIFTLDSADRAYRVLVETMNEGTATLGFDGTILYCNRRLTELLRMPLPDITGTSIYRYIAPEDANTFKAILEHKMGSGEVKLRSAGGKTLPVYLSVSSLQAENSPNAWCIVVTDLTEQKKNEEIVAAERLARSIIEQSAEVIAVCDTSGKVIRFSNSMSRLLGFVPTFQRFEDIVNLQFSEGADAGKSVLPISSALKGLAILGAEVTFESRECQSRLHLLLNSEPLNNSEGEIIGCVMTLTDITERKRAEKELKLAYEELETQSEELLAQAEELRIVNEALNESEKRFKLLSEANALLLSNKDPEAAIQDIAENVMRHLNCDVCFNYVYDEIRGKLHLNAYAGISAEAAKEIEWLDKEDGAAICSCVARDNCRIIAENLQHNRDKQTDLMYSMWIQAYACQPLLIGEKKIGTLSFGTKSRKDFTEDELALMSTVADQVSVAIERKHAEEALKKANDTLEEKVIERTAELEEACNSLLENQLRLSEAQKIAHLGNWEWNLINDEMHWSDEIYRIFGLDRLELVPTYNEFLSHIDPEDRSYVHNTIQKALSGELYNIEYRITLPDGGKHVVHSQGGVVFDEKHIPVGMKVVIQDITERKKAEEALEKTEKVRIKEIHHRIKNNLQVISSLLDLQAEKFEDEIVKEAFIEAQNRVISMSLLHEELYKGEGTITLDFSAYVKKLAKNLFQIYSLQNDNICLDLDLEDNAFLDMDTAVPLGIIVNELVSNSLKHAFTEAEAGEIRIQLCRDEETSDELQKSIFSLTISDNGKGIPKDLELENAESLGLQLVGILVDQIDGELELKREQGTEFRITFSMAERCMLPD